MAISKWTFWVPPIVRRNLLVTNLPVKLLCQMDGMKSVKTVAQKFVLLFALCYMNQHFCIILSKRQEPKNFLLFAIIQRSELTFVHNSLTRKLPSLKTQSLPFLSLMPRKAIRFCMTWMSQNILFAPRHLEKLHRLRAQSCLIRLLNTMRLQACQQIF